MGRHTVETTCFYAGNTQALVCSGSDGEVRRTNPVKAIPQLLDAPPFAYK